MKKYFKLFAIVAFFTLTFTACNNPETKETNVTESIQATESETEAGEENVEKVDKRKVFVSPQWVKSVIDGEQEESKNYVILDAAWGEEKDSTYSSEGHIPGAIHVDIASVEGEPMWNLLPADQLEKNMLDLGITKDKVVILSGDDPSGTARVAYAYLWAGVENVKVVDGGRKSWTDAGYEFEKESNSPKPADDFGAKVPVHPEYQLSIEKVKEKLDSQDKDFQLVSIRSENEWLGKTSGYTYMDKAGEPKGAIWGMGGSDPYHMEDYLHDDGTYKTPEELKTMYDELGISLDKEMSFYCGTGWRASIPFLILYENGNDNISMYDGGWFEWISDPTNKVQVGDPNSNDVEYTTVDKLPNDKAAK